MFNVKLKFAIELQAVYLRGTTYLRTPLFGMISVVTLFVKGAGAVVALLRLDSGAIERRVYTGCVQAHAASDVIGPCFLAGLPQHQSVVISVILLQCCLEFAAVLKLLRISVYKPAHPQSSYLCTVFVAQTRCRRRFSSFSSVTSPTCHGCDPFDVTHSR